MKIEFNALGAVSDIITNDEPLRQGNVGANTLTAVFEGKSNLSYNATFNYTRSDNSRLKDVAMSPTANAGEYYYKFSNPWFFALYGETTLTVYLKNSANEIVASGQITFSIEQTDFDTDTNITYTEYQALLDAITDKQDKFNLNNVRGYDTIVLATTDLPNLIEGQIIIVKGTPTEIYQVQAGELVDLIVNKATRDSLGNVIKDSYVSAVYPTYNNTTDKLFIETYSVEDALLANNEVILPKATTTKNGLMSKEDKVKVDGFQSQIDSKQSTSQKGQPNGYASLDSGGKVPSTQLPSYVDDVLEFANLASFPATGSASVIYVALDTNLTYRWSGSAYVEISPSLALGETSSTAYRGDKGKTAYDHSQVVDGSNPHGTTFSSLASKPTTLSGFGITDAVPTSRTIVGISLASDISTSQLVSALADDEFSSNGELFLKNKTITNSLLTIALSDNLIDPSKVDSGKYISYNGSEVALAVTSISGFIKVNYGDIVRFKYCNESGASQQGAIYNSSKVLTTVISEDNATISNGVVQYTVATDGYIRINIKNSELGTSCMLTINKAYPNEFQSYFYKIYLNDNVLFSNEKSQEIFASGLLKANVVNAFTKTGATLGEFINYQGTTYEDNGYGLTDFLPISYGTIYYTQKRTGYGKNYVLCLYKSDKETTVSFNPDTQIEEITLNGTTYWKITIPNNPDIKYVRFSFLRTEQDTKMVVSGLDGTSYPSVYIPYNYTTRYLPNYVKFSPEQIQDIQEMTEQTSPLYEKSMACCGDSIMESRLSGDAANGGGWAKTIGDANDMSVNNIAVSGSKLSNYYEGSSLNATKTIYKKLETLEDAYDYLCFDGGVNDFAQNVALGTITSLYADGSSNYDTDTILGGLEALCSRLVFHHQTAKKLFVFNHRIYSNSETKSNIGTWQYFIEQMKAVLKKWGIAFIDLETEVPPINLLGSTFKNTYTANGDGWHPNSICYEKFYVDKIEAKLKTL